MSKCVYRWNHDLFLGDVFTRRQDRRALSSSAEQDLVVEFKIDENVIFQSVGKFDSRLDFAHVSISHSDSTTEEVLDNSSFPICENVSSHFHSFEYTVERI